MHISRAKQGDTSKEIGLRSYFNKKERLQNDFNAVMISLKKSQAITNWETKSRIVTWWQILETNPNYYWSFPLHVFLHKYGGLTQENVFELPKKHEKNFIILLKETVKYLFVKGVAHNTVNVVRDTIFRVCALIEKEEDYIGVYRENRKNDKDAFKRAISTGDYGRYGRGLILIAAALNPKQNEEDYAAFLCSGYHIEHILPKQWNNYDKWTSYTWEKNLNLPGNLAPLEWKKNISAQNAFFDRKKAIYSKSKVQNIKDLLEFTHWYPEDFKERNQEVIKRLIDFFA